MKYIFTLLAFILGASAAHADITQVGKQGLQSIELLTNPGFENGKARWTNSGGSFSLVTSGGNFLGIGRTNATWQASASGQYLESETVTVPVALQGKACSASIMTFGGDANLQLQPFDGSNNALATALTLQAQTIATPAQVTFRCPSSGSVKFRLQSTAASALIALDSGHLGDQGLYQVAQAQVLGTITMTGCSGNWSTTSTTMAAFSAQTGCTYATTGAALAPSTNIPAIKFASVPPGEIWLEYEGFIGSGGTSSSNNVQFQFTDGTNAAREKSWYASVASSEALGPSIFQSLSYTTAQSNVTFQIYGQTNTSANSAIIGGSSGAPGVIKVLYFPSQAQTAYRADQTPASWSGYIGGTANWTTTSGTFGDGTIAGSATINQRQNRNFGAVTLAASNRAGITWTPPRPGNYFFCAYPAIYSSVAQNSYARLYDGTNILASAAMSGQAGGNAVTLSLCSVINAPSTSAQSQWVQIAQSGAGSTFINNYPGNANPVEFSIVELDAPLAMPFVLNQVTSGNANGEAVQRANITVTQGSGTNWAVGTQSGSWITAVATGAANSTTLTVSGFSGTPSCTCSNMTGSSRGCTAAAQSSTSVNVATFLHSSGSPFIVLESDPFSIICMGPK